MVDVYSANDTYEYVRRWQASTHFQSMPFEVVHSAFWHSVQPPAEPRAWRLYRDMHFTISQAMPDASEDSKWQQIVQTLYTQGYRPFLNRFYQMRWLKNGLPLAFIGDNCPDLELSDTESETSKIVT